MQIILVTTLVILRCVTVVLKLTKKGRGTALPGLLIEKYFPQLIPHIFSKTPYTILITGTNGKTSTRSFLVKILESKYRVISNRSGSNMQRGILSEVLSQMDILGNIKADYAVFEVEEATIPRLSSLLKPKQIIVTNLFRDQLDAYGEIDRTFNFIQQAVTQSAQATIIINGDDPRLLALEIHPKSKHFYCGIDDRIVNKFKYEGQTPSNNEEKLVAREIKVLRNLNTSFKWENYTTTLQLPGYFQVYNALYAIKSADLIGIDKDTINRQLQSMRAPFGRGERVKYKSKDLTIFLIKNPAGFNLTLNLLTHIENPTLVFILNDRIADGKDVSWIWDSSLEVVSKIAPKSIYCVGERAEDMLLRIKYSLTGTLLEEGNYYKDTNSTTRVYLCKEQKRLLKYLENEQSSEIFIMATYTAMLELRKLLTGNALNV